MTDKNNTELERGDLILFTPHKVIDTPGELIIFDSMETKTITCGSEDNLETVEINVLKYYPLSKEGEQVAIYDTDGTQTSKLYREKKFTITNIDSCDLLKMDTVGLRGVKKDYYDSIRALIV